jgi:hypothetical protein
MDESEKHYTITCVLDSHTDPSVEINRRSFLEEKTHKACFLFDKENSGSTDTHVHLQTQVTQVVHATSLTRQNF